jgi:hypothetical protein
MAHTDDTSIAADTPALALVVDLDSTTTTPICIICSLETAAEPDLPLWQPAVHTQRTLVINRLWFFTWVPASAHRTAHSLATHQIALDVLLTIP